MDVGPYTHELLSSKFKRSFRNLRLLSILGLLVVYATSAIPILRTQVLFWVLLEFACRFVIRNWCDNKIRVHLLFAFLSIVCVGYGALPLLSVAPLGPLVGVFAVGEILSFVAMYRHVVIDLFFG